MSGDASVPEFLSQHEAGDTWCNDGWRIFSNGSKVTLLTRQAQSRKLLFDFWYPPLQGYSPDGTVDGNLRFDEPPATVAGWIRAGLKSDHDDDESSA